MSGTTNVDQNEIKFCIAQFFDNEKGLTVAERQEQKYAIQIRRNIEINGAIDLPVEPNQKLIKEVGVKLKSVDAKKDTVR